MSVSAVRSVVVEGPQPKPKGPYTYASNPRGLYNNAKLKKDPSCAMPPAPGPAVQASAFTVLHQGGQRVEAARPSLPRSVNVVKPLQHEDPPALVPAPPNTILDPKFSRALDFKLRRLKEKEILQANLRRPTRPQPRLAASNPNLSTSESSWPGRLVSRSQPRIDAIPPDEDRSSKISCKMESSPSPGAGAGLRSHSREPDKPRFVTTVKTGQFLPPPPELACLLGLQTLFPPARRERVVYEYASKPKAVPIQRDEPPCGGAVRLLSCEAVSVALQLFDKGVELEVGVQTDLFVDRPTTPLYVPAKTGADAATQIYPGDLFDFDVEVQPILEVLVGKTTEQALAEVAQEEELCTLREQQRRYVELRDAERAERHRLAAQDDRLNREKVARAPCLACRDERRVAQARVAQQAAVEARERAAAAALVQGYVAELLPAVLAGLRDQGYLLQRAMRGSTVLCAGAARGAGARVAAGVIEKTRK
ncbi:Radial spoke head protein 3-like protein [Operophtera brumata]|uniref:Radial spoke head protein 3-like protein n=1 Tax=Operophtera brumata TaxID=104452 RepID=A0A0L7KWE6_OPEBR|nr:Radial spoke head protein 3-like protein [Operophtera brumata]